jgi:hypothetical protein
VSGSGSAVLVFLLDKDKLSYPAICFFALLGALATLGFFRWELCNIQTCVWLAKCGCQIEEALGKKFFWALLPTPIAAETIWPHGRQDSGRKADL